MEFLDSMLLIISMAYIHLLCHFIPGLPEI